MRIFDFGATEKRDIDLALLLAATSVKNLDANVMRQHQIVLAAIFNPNVPENSFGIGVRIPPAASSEPVPRAPPDDSLRKTSERLRR